MDTQRILDALNSARSRELAVIIQYMEHHYVAAGTVGLPSVVRQTTGDIWVRARGSGLAAKVIPAPDAVVTLKSVAKIEMLHAQSFANRVTALGGVPTVTPGERCKASSVREMLELDLAAEDEAVTLYTDYVELCRQQEDAESATLFEKTLADERAHATTFRRLLASLG